MLALAHPALWPQPQLISVTAQLPSSCHLASRSSGPYVKHSASLLLPAVPFPLAPTLRSGLVYFLSHQCPFSLLTDMYLSTCFA